MNLELLFRSDVVINKNRISGLAAATDQKAAIRITRFKN